jgi:hypothetical protein
MEEGPLLQDVLGSVATNLNPTKESQDQGVPMLLCNLGQKTLPFQVSASTAVQNTGEEQSRWALGYCLT